MKSEANFFFFGLRPSLKIAATLLLLMACIAAATFTPVAAYAQPASECMQIDVKDNSTVVTNRCDEPITVAYCSLGKPIWGKNCGGEEGKGGGYYTQQTNLKPGASSNSYGYPNLRVVACRGAFYTGIKSDSSGVYTCPVAKVDPRGKPNALVAGSALTESRACELARSMFAAPDRSSEPCKCSAMRNGQVYHCTATGWLKEPPSENNQLREFVEDLARCDPKIDFLCEKKKTVWIGVRG